MAGVTKKFNSQFYVILIILAINVNSHLWLVTFMSDISIQSLYFLSMCFSILFLKMAMREINKTIYILNFTIFYEISINVNNL